MSKNEFVANAPVLTLTIQNQPITGTARKFSTGSVGWNLTGKAIVLKPDGTPLLGPDGKPVRVQVTGNATVIGSKEWTDEAQAA